MMKKLIFILTMVLTMVFSVQVDAVPGSDDSVVIHQRRDKVRDTTGNQTLEMETRRLVFICTGDSVTGAITETEISDGDLNFIRGWYFYRIEAYPTAGGTVPLTGADVFILDREDMDLLGSEDGSTTAYAGLNLIHATLKKAALPNMFLTRAGNHVNYYWDITDHLSLKVSGQTKAAADYTIELFFRLK